MHTWSLFTAYLNAFFSCYRFVSKQRSGLFDRDRPDWAPSVNMRCQTTSIPAPKLAKEHFNRRKKRMESARCLAEEFPEETCSKLTEVDNNAFV
ncbi:hypothetical protein ACF0H5_009396 [Mactra antiquata]